METIERLCETVLGPADLADAGQLVVEADWNQTDDDWRVFIELGRAFGLRADDGTLVASAAVLPHGREFGWVSMVLVTRAWRRRGLATRLLQRCIDELRAQHRVPGLDATPAGREVYRHLGFVDGWPITRMQGRAPATTDASALVRPARADDLPALAAFDECAFGADRSHLLSRLLQRAPQLAFVAERGERIEGFVLGRDGRVATYVGPLVAADEQTAIALLNHTLAHTDGSVYLDMLDRHTAVRAWLERAGFTAQRPYTRMLLGRAQPFGDDRLTVAIAGPELG